MSLQFPEGVAARRGRKPDTMAHPEYPLVLHVHDRTRTLAVGLPRSALAALERAGIDAVFAEPAGVTVNVYARTEAAAEAATAALRRAHGDRIDIVGPEVRYWPGPPPREPVMTLEARMPLLFGAFVRRELLRRRGLMLASEPARRRVALRAEVPLAPLLGFPRWIDALTDGRAELSIVLARYAPLGEPEPGPGPLAA
jgi:hypothetical protein